MAHSPCAPAPSLGGALGIRSENEGTEVQRGGGVSPRNPPGPLLAAWECHAWPQAQSCLRDPASCTPTGFTGPQFSLMQSGSQFLAPRAVGCRARVNRVLPLLPDGGWSPVPQSCSVRSGWSEDSERVGVLLSSSLNARGQSAFLSHKGSSLVFGENTGELHSPLANPPSPAPRRTCHWN